MSDPQHPQPSPSPPWGQDTAGRYTPPSQPPYPQQPPYPPAALGYASAIDLPRTSGIAIAALVIGILSLTCVLPVILSVVAIILGGIGISQTKDPRVKGRGMAIAGLVCGIASILLVIPLMLSILLPSLSRAREAANRIKCGSNLRQIGQGMRAYAIDDPEGFFPADLETLYALMQPGIVPQVFVCPASTDSAAAPPFVLGQNLSYVYLASGMTDAAVASTPVAYCQTHNHGDGTNVLYLDGSVLFVVKSQYPPEVTPTAGQ